MCGGIFGCHSCGVRGLPLVSVGRDQGCFSTYYNTWGSPLAAFAQAAVTKHHGLGGLNKRIFFSLPVLGGRQSKIKSIGLVSSEISLHGLQMAIFLLCPCLPMFVS